MTDELGFFPTLQDGSRFRYEISSTASSSTNLDTEQGGVGGAKVVDVLCLPYTQQGIIGIGSVHHVAFGTPTDEHQLVSSTENLNNNNKRIIIVDDEQDILLTYRDFFRMTMIMITSLTDPSLAMNYIRNILNFNDILLILDIRMKNLNGFQLHQQIKSIDPTIKIIFITALDILDEISTIIPGISREQIMRKPVDKNLFTYTVKQLLN